MKDVWDYRTSLTEIYLILSFTATLKITGCTTLKNEPYNIIAKGDQKKYLVIGLIASLTVISYLSLVF